jgi:hypothetical protein
MVYGTSVYVLHLDHFEQSCQTDWLEWDGEAGGFVRDVRAVLVRLLEQWRDDVNAFRSGEVTFLPFDFDEEGTGWLQVTALDDEIVEVLPISYRTGGWSIDPSSYAEDRRKYGPRQPSTPTPESQRMSRQELLDQIDASIATIRQPDAERDAIFSRGWWGDSNGDESENDSTASAASGPSAISGTSGDAGVNLEQWKRSVQSMYELDGFPGKGAKVEIDLELLESGKRQLENGEVYYPFRIRFRAVKERSVIKRRFRNETSDWTGWFEYEGEPIRLTWDAFWAG